ncbi:hypothetical protein ACGF5C_31440 [Micromonospora sp. NPDC047620]|uniref:hypothetical protein n=1 Tax=Micromonospora sp. NPDC047620 TaxID=3364251 RepID=UPI003723AABD
MYGTTYDESGTTRVPAGETDYLAKAADLLEKAAAANERENAGYRALLMQGWERIAGQYAQLGAIQRGQLPASLAHVMFEQLSGTTKGN